MLAYDSTSYPTLTLTGPLIPPVGNRSKKNEVSIRTEFYSDMITAAVKLDAKMESMPKRITIFVSYKLGGTFTELVFIIIPIDC